mmetsp:Transcript_15230/g.27107  ORF Transcript_15230/g.27107 Transcript_15230/m.27107 type:complete len:205 (+) Transcript_15230:394-1008(+)
MRRAVVPTTRQLCFTSLMPSALIGHGAALRDVSSSGCRRCPMPGVSSRGEPPRSSSQLRPIGCPAKTEAFLFNLSSFRRDRDDSRDRDDKGQLRSCFPRSGRTMALHPSPSPSQLCKARSWIIDSASSPSHGGAGVKRMPKSPICESGSTKRPCRTVLRPPVSRPAVAKITPFMSQVKPWGSEMAEASQPVLTLEPINTGRGAT